MTQFNRSASVIVGAFGGTGIVLKNLRIGFVINKTLEKTPNDCTVEIFNLSENTRNRLDHALPTGKEPAEKIIVNAGYIDEEGESVIFIGDITSITHVENIPEWVTTIKAQDGNRALTETKANLSFAKGVTVQTVLTSILNLFPLAKDIILSSIGNKAYDGGFFHIGAAKAALDKVTKYAGLEWSIQDDVIRILTRDESDKNTVISINNRSGMIGSPIKINSDKRKAKGKSKQNKPGWTVLSLLQNTIIPGNQIALNSKQIPDITIFKVIEIQHIGDTHGTEFNSKIRVTE